MNGVHDLGGFQNFGPIVPEAGEPAFHAAWERRAFGLTLAMGAVGGWNLDQSRAARESIPPARYLASSYYQIWFDGLVQLLRERELVSDAELAAGRMHEAPPATVGVLTAAEVPAALARGKSTQRPAAGNARFGDGAAVRTRTLNTPTHTRLPRYCRGKRGVVTAVHGAHVFPDANACGLGEQPHWLYTVRFEAGELWGPDTTASAVYVDCWEPYLEAC